MCEGLRLPLPLRTVLPGRQATVATAVLAMGTDIAWPPGRALPSSRRVGAARGARPEASKRSLGLGRVQLRARAPDSSGPAGPARV